MTANLQLDVFTSLRGLRDAQSLMTDVQELNFAGCWLAEGPRPIFAQCAAAALADASVTLGTGVAVAFARSPMVTAQAAWMLAEATGGRFILGLGSQVKAHVERRFSAPFAHPGRRMEEYVGALRAIFRAFRGEERLHFDGEFYSFSLLPDAWSPGPMDYQDPAVYVAGVRPWMCQMIGRAADGMYVHPLHNLTYLDSVVRPSIAAGAAQAGRDAADVALICPLMTAVGDDEADVMSQREELRARLAWYGSTPGTGSCSKPPGGTASASGSTSFSAAETRRPCRPRSPMRSSTPAASPAPGTRCPTR